MAYFLNSLSTTLNITHTKLLLYPLKKTTNIQLKTDSEQQQKEKTGKLSNKEITSMQEDKKIRRKTFAGKRAKVAVKLLFDLVFH